MSIIERGIWWGYIDDTGVIRVKKYIDDKQIWKCEQMPFCKGIFDPFEAWGYEDAKQKIAKFLTEQQYYDKKDQSNA